MHSSLGDTHGRWVWSFVGYGKARPLSMVFVAGVLVHAYSRIRARIWNRCDIKQIARYVGCEGR
jgi:hypothetical protein